jgi:hypothetical protein
MSKASVEILTFGIEDFEEFKKDKNYNAPWAERGIYLTVSPFRVATPQSWSINVTAATNLTTIRPSALALPKYDDGHIILIRRTDKGFTEYETDWIAKQLYEILRKTDLDFTCANPVSNPITYDEDKQDELSTIVPAILEELADYKYVPVQRYLNEPLPTDEVHTDESALQKFAGFLDVTVNYDASSNKLRFIAKDRSQEAETVFSASFTVTPPQSEE